MSSVKRGKGPVVLARKFRVPSASTADAVESFLMALDCPRALTVWLLFINHEHSQLVNLECRPEDHLTPWSFRQSYAATELLSKYKDLTIDVDLEEVALQKFREFELLCADTNRNFRNLSSHPNFNGERVWLHNAIKLKIESILGEPDLREFFSLASWGPGASTLIKRKDASDAHKFQCEIGITRELYDVICPGGSLKILREFSPLWTRQLMAAGFPLFQMGNNVVTVPKNAKTNRPIAIEPGFNLWFQKAIGQMLRRKLRGPCSRIDLRYQSRNQGLAQEGSEDLFIATVDFSSASDSIAAEVVRELIPDSWYRLMNLTRSSRGRLKNEVFRWNKFSSMGNGFTFELESLIFYAIAISCVEYECTFGPHASVHRSDYRRAKRVTSVYGDDVIIPVFCLERFRDMCAFYGFRVNEEKTHSSSPFRESCGSHFYGGIDVKPIYLKQKMTTLLSVYRFANSIRRMAHRWGNSHSCDSTLKMPFDLLKSKVPKVLRYLIPDGYGDGGFISNFDEATPRRAKDWVEGFQFTFVEEIPQKRAVVNEGRLLASLFELVDKEDTRNWIVSRKTGKTVILRNTNEPRYSPPDPTWKYPIDLETGLTLYPGNYIPGRDPSQVKLNRHGHVLQWYNLGAWE